MKALAVALVLVLAVATARAQPGNVEPQEEPPPPPPAYLTPAQRATAPDLEPEKSESTAFWLSFGGTVGSYALIFVGGAIASESRHSTTSSLAGSAATVGLAGTLLAPTFGHWYAGKGFTRGFGLRLGAIAVGLTAIVVALSGCSIGFGGHEQEDPDCGQGEVPGALLGIGALGMWVGGTVDDIIQAPRRVVRNNAARYALTPLLQPDGASLVLAGSF